MSKTRKVRQFRKNVKRTKGASKYRSKLITLKRKNRSKRSRRGGGVDELLSKLDSLEKEWEDVFFWFTVEPPQFHDRTEARKYKKMLDRIQSDMIDILKELYALGYKTDSTMYPWNESK